MGFFKRKKKDEKLCPNCGKPVTEGIVFCDSCGFRIIPPPACAKCNLPLAPETNFCESCGTPVGTVPAPDTNPPPPEVPAMEIPKKGKSQKGKKNRKKTIISSKPGEAANPVIPVTEKTVLEKTIPEGSPMLQAPAGIVKVETKDKVPIHREVPLRKTAVQSPKPRISRRMLIGSCILILGIILAVTTMTGLLKVPSPTFLQGIHNPFSPGQAPAISDSRPADTPPSPTPTVQKPDLVPGPTQVPPESLRVWFQAERDPITNKVTVLFDGGKGQRGVREVEARLTRSDGEVLTQTFKPVTTGAGAGLQGTKYTDRLEVIVFYNNGDVYTVIDKVFEYKIRN